MIVSPLPLPTLCFTVALPLAPAAAMPLAAVLPMLASCFPAAYATVADPVSMRKIASDNL